MSSLYEKSRIWYEYAVTASGKMQSDETQKDYACFNAQQALEFLMKYILEQLDVEVPKTHNIRMLLDLLDEAGFEFDKRDELDNLADTITDWEEKSRYTEGIRTTQKTVNRVFKIIDSMNEAWLIKMRRSELEDARGF